MEDESPTRFECTAQQFSGQRCRLLYCLPRGYHTGRGAGTMVSGIEAGDVMA